MLTAVSPKWDDNLSDLELINDDNDNNMAQLQVCPPVCGDQSPPPLISDPPFSFDAPLPYEETAVPVSLPEENIKYEMAGIGAQVPRMVVMAGIIGLLYFIK